MLSLTYNILMFILLVVLLIHSILIVCDLFSYVTYGIILGIIFILLDSAIIPLKPNTWKTIAILEFLITDVIAFIKAVIWTCMGLHCCSALGTIDIPLMKRLVDDSNYFEGFTWLHHLPAVIGVVAGGTVFSIILFNFTSPRLSEAMREMSDLESAELERRPKPSVKQALVAITFAFSEELVFRLGIQNYLATVFDLTGDRYWNAIVLASAFWSIGHANVIAPEWVKMVQIFPLGIALGFLFRNAGLESCILAHGLFNLSMMFLLPYLNLMKTPSTQNGLDNLPRFRPDQEE